MDTNEIFVAAYDGDAKGVQRAVQSGIDPNIQHPIGGYTPLQAACEADAIHAIKVLLAQGTDPNKRFFKRSRVDGRLLCDDSVALMHVTSAEAARLLLSAGADPSLVDRFGETALEVAEADGNSEVAAVLRQALD